MHQWIGNLILHQIEPRKISLSLLEIVVFVVGKMVMVVIVVSVVPFRNESFFLYQTLSIWIGTQFTHPSPKLNPLQGEF